MKEPEEIWIDHLREATKAHEGLLIEHLRKTMEGIEKLRIDHLRETRKLTLHLVKRDGKSYFAREDVAEAMGMAQSQIDEKILGEWVATTTTRLKLAEEASTLQKKLRKYKRSDPAET